MRSTTGTTLTERVAERVQQAMEAAAKSQVGLSEDTGIPRPTLNRRLRGQSPFQVDELEAIAAALDCSVAALIPLEGVA